jgi:hypothetical protein
MNWRRNSKLASYLLKLDRFEAPIKLTFRGRNSIPTFIGCLMTIVCCAVIGVYGVQRFQIYYYRQKPEVSSTVVAGAYGARDTVDLHESGYKLAFGAIDFLTGEALQDDSRVRWHVKMLEK